MASNGTSGSPFAHSSRAEQGRVRLLNLLTVIIGTAQLVQRSARTEHQLELERRMIRIEVAAHQLTHELADLPSDLHLNADHETG